jgi:hypothetical protein
MNCTECRKFLVAHIEDLLRPEAKKALEAHLDKCRQCREEISQMMHLHNRLTVDGKSYTVSDFESSVFERIFQEQTFEPQRKDEMPRNEEVSNLTKRQIMKKSRNLANCRGLRNFQKLTSCQGLKKHE